MQLVRFLTCFDGLDRNDTRRIFPRHDLGLTDVTSMSFDEKVRGSAKVVRRFTRLFVLAVALCAFCGDMTRGDTPCGSSPPSELVDPNSFATCQQSKIELAEPPELSSTNGKLEVKLCAKVAQNQIAHAYGKVTVETATYDGNLVGPTIKVHKGDHLRITVENQLHAVFCGLKPSVIAEDFPREFCVTNLHTHGLHISPKDPADNLYTSIYPGGSHQFEYQIPKNHPSGTFWYHPHRHGSVAMQLTGGMAGALIIEGDGLDELCHQKKIHSRILVLQQIHVSTDPKLKSGCSFVTDTIQKPCPYDIYDKWNANLPAEASPTPKARMTRRQQETLHRASLRAAKQKTDESLPVPPYALINGQYCRTITIAPGAIERWRFVHAGNDDGINLAVVDCPNQQYPHRLPLYEIAVDGLPRGKALKKHSNILYPGYRWDIVFQAPSKPGTYYLIGETLSDSQSVGPGAQPRQCLAKINVAGTPISDQNLPTDQELSNCVPKEFQSPISDASIENRRWIVRFNFQNTPSDAFQINGQEYDEDRIDRIVRTGTAEEWRLESEAQQGNAAGHPFHIHVNPFQQIVPGITAGPFATSTSTSATEEAKLVDLSFASQAAYQIGDSITISGTTLTGHTFTSTVVITATNTLGELMKDLNQQMAGLCPSGFQASIDSSGTWTIPTSGCGLATITVTNQGGQLDPRWSWKKGLVDRIWRDTLLVPAGGAETVRMKFLDFPGETVFHCHIVDHEDQGMMKNVLILGPNDPMPLGEARRKGQHAASSPAAAPLLRGKAPEWRVPLIDADGKRHTLAEFSDRRRVLVFFLGAGCQPCLEQLRAFRDVHDQFERRGITLIAVGSCGPRDLVSVKKSVEDKGHLPFIFLADPESKVFEQYQLVDRRDSGLLHGLFCLSPSGEVIWQSGGSATPYGNVLDTLKAFTTPLRSTQANVR